MKKVSGTYNKKWNIHIRNYKRKEFVLFKTETKNKYTTYNAYKNKESLLTNRVAFYIQI